MNTLATDNAISFLMASNNEDLAVDLANEVTALRLELERVKSIAFARLERIQDQVLELERVKEELERVKELTRKMNAYHEKRAIELEAKLERATLPSDMWDMFDQANA